VIKRLTSIIQNRFDTWLRNRMPASLNRTLDNKSIFIFPTRMGFAYLFVLLLVFLLGTNYQNNVIILLAYILASLFITVMLQSYYNFKGLTISTKANISGFAKQYIDVPFTVASEKHKYGLSFEYKNQPLTKLDKLDSTSDISVKYFAQNRGVISLTRLKISSEYSLGLFKTWTWCDFGQKAIIYPEIKPMPAKWLSSLKNDNVIEQENGDQYTDGVEDFHELNAYKEGEPLTHVAWKQLARGQGKFTKSYRQPVSSDTWLSLKAMPSSDLESKLSYLCYLVIQYSPQDVRFGLDLLTTKIPPNIGQAHIQECLEALAKYSSREV
jgi:uncharacterized protein (DUF58 family)